MARAIAGGMDNLALWLALLAVFICLGAALLGVRANQQKQERAAAELAAVSQAAAAEARAVAAAVPSPFLPEPAGQCDDLRQIKGIGPKLERQLHALGVHHYAQIGGWTPQQLAHVDARLGSFSGRPERDQWQSQARLLAAGDIKGYERAHGKLGTTTLPPGPAA